MDMLSVKGCQIVDSDGKPVRLRGTCVGGWMNMEDFINGYPGSEHALRRVMAETIGKAKAEFFFERWQDYFFDVADVAYIQSLGANLVRLALNYRQFESDMEPYKYIEKGFERLTRAIEWCAKHNVYVILDLHSIQGWQNTDWHCDNTNRANLFWQIRDFQDRFIALWEEIARRYKGNPTLAGYGVMNEPVANAPEGRFSDQYTPNWEALNAIYRWVVKAIRKVDADHIIFLEGDLFSSQFDGMDAPFAPNLVYSSHGYNASGFGPGRYPGKFGEVFMDRARMKRDIANSSGVCFSQKHAVPHWVGEFGAVYNGPSGEVHDRLRSMADQIGIYEELDIHWTSWTYKDLGTMGWVQLDPNSEYMQFIQPILKAKRSLATDYWQGWLSMTPARQKVYDLANFLTEELSDAGVQSFVSPQYLMQAVLGNYTGALLQYNFAALFKDLSEAQLDRILASFALTNCQPMPGLEELIRNRCLNSANET